MARGDVVVFDEAKAMMIAGNWASDDHFYIALCDNTTTPVAGTATPVIGDFTEVGAAGSYVAGGTDLGAIAGLVSEAAGVMTFDTVINPSWAQNALNDVDAYWGIIYNFTDGNHDAVAFLDLGGPVDMQAGDLTITWNALGMFTIT
jgi:hypothetical protein